LKVAHEANSNKATSVTLAWELQIFSKTRTPPHADANLHTSADNQVRHRFPMNLRHLRRDPQQALWFSKESFGLSQ
jgi:hypothetical protein